MSVHQYIGARYVPYYYENSLDPTSTEWEPNVHYEALTVVTLPNQHSYISKKDVPDTVGSPALNADYWLDTGSDNAYIAQLQQDLGDVATLTTSDKSSAVNAINEVNAAVGGMGSTVTTLSNDVATLKNKVNRGDLIIITDSYGTIADNFTTYLSDLGINDIYDNVYIVATAGNGGFYTGQWPADVTTVVVADTDKIKDILVVGGTNDAKANSSSVPATVSANIASFFTNIKNRFANIENVYYLYCPHVKLSNYTNVNMQICFRTESQSFTDPEINTHFVNASFIYDSFTETLSDKMHPDAAGSKRIANACLSLLKGEEISFPGFSGGHTFTGGYITLQCYKDEMQMKFAFNGSYGNINGQTVTEFNFPIDLLIPARVNDGSMAYIFLHADGSVTGFGFPTGYSGTVQCYYDLSLPSYYLGF